MSKYSLFNSSNLLTLKRSIKMMIDAAVALASEVTEQGNFMNNPFPKFDTEQEIVRVKFQLIEE